ncbi:hypothetical protein [Mesonia sp. K4-1]|uniref:hypothetical protein n=1 Tax=Mesonia sp. K4-1 TaxID=2602760 RepID=UPI0011CAD02F|nr:hypothetical protein [Mesonia sp. K4-1]TXK79649.1 hypothetical protein FT986_00545 [Mesonia sp. K4-1]
MNQEILKQFENKNQLEKEILLIAKKSNDSILSIFVYNNSKDSIIVSRQDSSLFLIQEAKNENGKWKPIEYWQRATCVNSYNTIKIKPNGVIETKSIAYKGSFKTKIRFKLYDSDQVYYSNSLDGNINPNQFEIPDELFKKVYSRYTEYKVGKELFKKIIFLGENSAKEFKKKYDNWWEEINKKMDKRNKSKN